MKVVLLLVGCAAAIFSMRNFGILELDDPRPPRLVVTSSSLALQNLSSQIKTLEDLTSRFPEKLQFQQQLFELLLTRSQFLGSYDDFKHLRDISNSVPKNAEGSLLRARYFSAIHDFSNASQELLAATKNGASQSAVARQQYAIQLARHDDLNTLKKEIGDIVKEAPSLSNQILLSAVEADLGNFARADDALADGISAYKDSSPFPLAQAYFQRGLLWGEKARDLHRAKIYYTEATYYVPEYVVAKVHLAEVLNTLGDQTSAIKTVETVAIWGYPEPKALLGMLLKSSGDSSKAPSYIANAKSTYEELLRAYPFAFADHGAEFFTGPGENPERAVQLATMNLRNRPTERSYIVAIQAAQAADDKALLCSLSSEAKRLNPVYIGLQELLVSLDPCSEDEIPAK